MIKKLSIIIFLFLLMAENSSAAISATQLTTKTVVSSTSLTSNTYTPSANKLILISIAQRTNISVEPNQPTVSGNGLTWELVNTVMYDTTPTTLKRVSVYRAMSSSPTTGKATVDCGEQQQTDIDISIAEFDGVDTSGSNGSGAIVQSVTNTATGTTSLTVPLSSFSSVNNATYAAFGLAAQRSTTPGDGFTALHNQYSPSYAIASSSIFRNDNDTSADITFSGTAAEVGGVAIEIKAASYTHQNIISSAKIGDLKL